ncbi:MAG TPA: hypothetical protein VFK13_13800 [Gemmatimonadaceae bacterium]|nr:hypothetical protein [Gemmatimonadaceae bacterium]
MPKRTSRPPVTAEDARVGRFAGLGCLLTVAGFFGGGMIAVLIAAIVGWFTRCTPPEGLPACGTIDYLLIGAVAGMVLLPTVAFWRLRRAAATQRNQARE